MSMKKHDLVMLNTKENKKAILAYLGGAIENMGLTTSREDHFTVPSGIQVHHNPAYTNLYVLANEGKKIRKGDWYIVVEDRELHQHTGGAEPFIGARKVLATSDPELFVTKKIICKTCIQNTSFSKPKSNCPDCKGTGIVGVYEQVPQVSMAFIEKFRNKYCKDNEIKKVMIEYDEYTPYISHETSLDERTYLKLKLNNNTVTIKKCKDSWSEKEVKQLCWKAYTNGMPKMSPNDISEQLVPKFDKWFETNINES